MNIEEAIEILSDDVVGYAKGHEKYEEAVKTLLTAYEKEKEKNSKLLEALDTVNHEKGVFIESYEKEKEKNKKIEKELEKHIEFCEQEAEGSLNNEICHISLRFNKRLLDIIKEE